MRALVLRPEPGATATCRRAAGAGCAAVSAPLFTVRALAWGLPVGHFDAVLATSASAMRLGGARLGAVTHLPLYAVGAATADAARVAGFADVRAGDADAAALVARAAGEGARRLLHLAGRERRAIAHPGVEIVAVEVYAADAVAALPDAVAGALADGAVALLHSPRAAALFATLADRAGLARGAIPIAAISPAALAAAGTGWARATAARVPTDLALLAAARGLAA